MIRIKKNTTHISHTSLIEALVKNDYNRVNMVLDQGEFAVRGNIIDIFPSNHSYPIRIEYEDDRIERLCSFNPHTQRSLSHLDETAIDQAISHDSYTTSQSLTLQSGDHLLSEIDINDVVVHEYYGIGRYKGLHHLTINNHEGEYGLIQYAGNDRVYVPMEQFNRIYRYSGTEIAPRINSLSDGQWKRTLNRAKKAAELYAKEMYQMYLNRIQQPGFPFSKDTNVHRQFDLEFEHNATDDQQTVTAEIKKDMEFEKPMDRLLCGDVGYGKTEIMCRAAFKAVNDGKQVAVLVPTTLLSSQHTKTFIKRFENTPYIIKELSRMVSHSDQKRCISGLQTHAVDIVVGTHKILQKNITFADLGLLIVDEEQRFGVTHKEKMMALKHHIDILYVSATPIPRSLYMALSGARDVSVINTAPVKRRSIQTTITQQNTTRLKHAINTEIKRHGQVFYIYNNVGRMPDKHYLLQQAFPHLTVAMAHGQMPKAQLEATMQRFVDGKVDILLSSTIIENGLDIPNANTIIIENCHLFGLAQIHQLRGRVGRSDTQAYAYLFYPDLSILKDTAIKRLQAIREYASLGCGYKLALKDLEIRGAGSMIGHKQSGHVTMVGFDMYCQLLEEAVNKYKNTPSSPKKHFKFSKHVKAMIPPYYISNERERLAIYKRLSSVTSKTQLQEIIIECEDRYGAIPQLARYFFNAISAQLK